MSPEIRWDRLPVAASIPAARDWLERQGGSDLSAATVDAYSRAVERYLARCRELRLHPRSVTTAQVASYFDELESAGLGPAAIRQRYVAIRLFYAWVVERRERPDNPLGSGIPRVGDGEATGPPSVTGPPWLPDTADWSRILDSASSEPLRTRLMIAVAYLGALRREDICHLEASTSGLRRHRLLLGGPDGRRAISISEAVAARIGEYAGPRPTATLLFRSESRRNPDQPISVWTWAKLTRLIADRSGVTGFTSATLRHLRLADLAARGQSAREIADAAGYRSPRLAYRYLRAAREGAVAGADGREEQIDQLVSAGGR